MPAVRRGLLLALGLLATALAACAPEPAVAKPPVWVVRDADSELVIFGSVHVLPPGLDWRPPSLEAALAEADDLWFELPVDPAAEAEIAGLAAARGVGAPGWSLSASLSPEGAQRLRRAVDALGLGFALVDRLEPWFAEVMLAAAQYRRAGADAAFGVEKAISAAAPAGIERRAFETPDEQIALFDAAPLPEQIASLEQSLREMEARPDAYADLVARWMAADLDALEADVLAPLRRVAPVLYARLVSERNARWVVALAERLDGSGRTVVVVGVGHLVGEEGLPAQLRALGYSVEGP